jgi:hypothetical protein
MSYENNSLDKTTMCEQSRFSRFLTIVPNIRYVAALYYKG